ncbi:glycoside hydrolase family 47 protein [Serpula lacrymans var. lacrymans S7.3]|uniref:alpha-1,2-Mannosidase n=2 Tax=Serpula lacrymans var. lacrymans TaxID=341189 RepID=F8QDV5_SERL3|nr:glycoside hydrolase family 47 protein [Serpula lacrymans var. lacrymans S7.9]EGN93776.1 glycoside hydrolase family 47 protein [Serpula lacrymans var. lacrymans S7.3]EGO19145.1 glycoside hydrolase family 47 protein [Serpula lacrymans var. lacrymans S7.9]
MSELRQRKKDATETQQDVSEVKATSEPKNQLTSRGFYAIILFVIAFAAYQYPSFIHDWLGLSESETLHGTRPDSIVDFSADIFKRDAVVEAFKYAWAAYERDAMGDDEYHPISHQGSNLTKPGGIGYTVVDSIDTMLIMGLPDEYERAKLWVANDMSFDRDAPFSTFETTIRVLGGLLAAYHLSGQDPLYLEKATELGNRILPAFDTESGLPLSLVNLAEMEGVPDKDNSGMISTAEAATLQLEFRYLAFLTDEDIYWEKAERVMAVIKQARMSHGLASIFMTQDGRFATSAIRLGSRGDSYYEYLLKQYLQTNQTEGVYREMYDDAMTGIHDHLVQISPSSSLTYTAELVPERKGQGLQWRLVPKQDHLVCFLGGSLMLGATTSGALVHPVSVPPRPEELTEQGKRDWKTGIELIRTCMATHDTQTGLSPEIAHFRTQNDNLEQLAHMPTDWYIKGARPGGPTPFDARYILRPETVESLFIAFRLTGDVQYREYGWAIFNAIEKHCKLESGGYAGVMNVDAVPVEHDDKMETFLMSETLKYLYLLFADVKVLPLNEYVFNTEAHPFPVFMSNIRTGFS